MDTSNRFFTETSAMRTFALSSARGDISFKIGLALIVVLGVAEIFSAGYYYVGRARAPQPAAETAAIVKAPPVTRPVAPPVAVATPAPTPAPTIAATVAPSTAALSADERLLKEATELNNRGDTANALNRLQQASEKNPKNAQVFAEMAKIYESASNFDRSNELWRKVQEIGPSAGAIYELADAKLKKGAVATPPPAAAAEASPADTAMARASVEGIPDGSSFGVSDVSATETPDNDADTNLMLRISVKKRPGTVVDHTKVKIQVFFYDTVDDKDIKLTDAEVNYEWLTPNHDWAQASPEILAVTYVRPKNKALSQEAALSAAAAAVNPGKKGRAVKPPSGADSADSGRRKYLGYIVRIYYNDKLQAQRADPSKLLTLFPSPATSP